jgi:hypothetical protein
MEGDDTPQTKYVRLLVKKHYPAGWVLDFPPLEKGDVVPVVPATNIPTPQCWWVNTPELRDDAYGILLYPGEYEDYPPGK